MIVFENVCVTGSCKINQGCSSRETHRHAKRKLVGGSDVNDFRRAMFRWAGNCDSLPIDRPRNHDCPCEPKSPASLVETRVLDPGDLPSIYESHCADHHCLLRSGSDDDLVWMTAGTSVVAQIGRKRFAQVGVATT